MRAARRYRSRRGIFAVLLLAVAWLWAPASILSEASALTADPRYGVYVVDEANVISEQTRALLYNRAAWLQAQTGSAQVAVATVASLEGTTLERLAVDTYRKLGLGSSERNDGVLLLYAAEDNRVRIEVGYGMEGRIPDGKAGSILDQYFVPNRDAGLLDEAFVQTQSALIIEMAAEYGIDATEGTDYIEPLQPETNEDFGNWFSDMPLYMKAVLGIGVVFLIVLDFKFTGGAVTWAILNMLGRKGGGGGRGGARGGGGSSGGGGASR